MVKAVLKKRKKKEEAEMGIDMDEDFKNFMGCIKKGLKSDHFMSLGDDSKLSVDVISTGINSLDKALGVGGLPRGRVIEIFGPESGGKTTLALQCIAACQKNGGIVAFLDAEHSLDPDWAQTIGVDIKRLAVAQPDYAEQAFNMINVLLDSDRPPDMIVLDSIASMPTKKEIEGEVEDLQKQVGLQARVNTQNLRKITPKLDRANAVLVIVNQVREKFGQSWSGYGPNETTPGGRAMRHAYSVRISVRKGEMLKEGTDFVGNRVKIRIAKNKVAAPFKATEFPIYYAEGIDIVSDIFMNAVERGVVEKRGAWYYYKDDKYQGRKGMIEALKNDEDLYQDLLDDLEKVVEE